MGACVTTCTWYPHEPTDWERDRGLPGYQPDPTIREHDSLADAEHHGQRWGCMRGVRRVEVRGQDGRLHALWDKDSQVTVKTRRYVVHGRTTYDVSHLSNRWQVLSEESRALAVTELAKTVELVRARRGW